MSFRGNEVTRAERLGLTVLALVLLVLSLWLHRCGGGKEVAVPAAPFNNTPTDTMPADTLPADTKLLDTAGVIKSRHKRRRSTGAKQSPPPPEPRNVRDETL